MDRVELTETNKHGALHTSMSNGWSRLPVASKRAFGLIVDCLCSTAICVTPMIVHLVVNAEWFVDGKFSSVNPALGGASLMLVAIYSPFPLMVLRLVCRVMLRSRTPGEMLCCYYNVGGSGSLSVAWRQAAYALLQYLAVLASFILAFLPAAIFCILKVILEGLFYPFYVSSRFAFVLFQCLSAMILLSGFFRPHNGELLCSYFDKKCGLDVVEDDPFESSKQPSLIDEQR